MNCLLMKLNLNVDLIKLIRNYPSQTGWMVYGQIS